MTDNEHFRYMAKALAIEALSPHPTHKVGAVLRGIDLTGAPFEVARHNFWPEPLEKHIGRNNRLGNASTTVHAEVAAILAAPASEGASIYVTNLCCPNCSKAIVEAGIEDVYLDAHTTQESLLANKIRPYFDMISARIFESAGISVYEMHEPHREIKQVVSAIEGPHAPLERPVFDQVIEGDMLDQKQFIAQILEYDFENGRSVPFAACYARDREGHVHFISAQPHLSIGLDEEDGAYMLGKQKKYRPTLQPLDRLLIYAVRRGLRIEGDYLYASQVPTSREFVNMIGAGFRDLRIGDFERSRDAHGLHALGQLKGVGFYKHSNVNPVTLSY